MTEGTRSPTRASSSIYFPGPPSEHTEAVAFFITYFRGPVSTPSRRGVLAACASFLLFVASLGATNSSVNSTKPQSAGAQALAFDRIMIGMTEAQVLSVAGSPETKYDSKWGYGQRGWIEFSATYRVNRIRKGEAIPPKQKPNLSVNGLNPSSTGNYFQQTTNPEVIHVRGYTRKDGTVVAPYVRTAPNSSKDDNFSTKGNANPYTGEAGTKRRSDSYATTATSADRRSLSRKSHAELVDTVQRCEQQLATYTNAGFGQRPFNAERYEQIRRERDIAQGELNAGN